MSENNAPSSEARAETAAPRVAVRHVQLIRAIVAAIAALMITFSSDHSASYGLAVFSGFAIATALVLGFAAWMAYPRGRRWPVATLAVVTAIAGMASGVPVWRTTPVFFAIVIAWAAVAGLIELLTGWRERRLLAAEGAPDLQRRSEARDAVTVGVIGLLLAVAIALVSPAFSLDYFIDDADQWFTLTGIVIAVGIFGAYAAIVAVYLGIAAFSPRRAENAASGPASASDGPAASDQASPATTAPGSGERA